MQLFQQPGRLNIPWYLFVPWNRPTTSHLKRILIVQLSSWVLFCSIATTVYAQLPGYSYRKEIQGLQATGSNLSEFPVLIHIPSDNDLRSVANGGDVYSATGDDIAFTESDGITPLNYEVEHYDPTDGELVAWVRMPTLPTAGTDIYLYYGNSEGANATPTSTWHSSYAGVWHMDQQAGEFPDATSNDNDGTDYVSASGTNGNIGQGQQFNRTDTDYVDAGNGSSLDISGSTLTMEGWIYMDGFAPKDEWYNVVSKEEYSLYLGGEDNTETLLGAYLITWRPDKGKAQAYDLWSEGTILIPDNTWTHVAVIFDGANEEIRGYVDGVLDWTVATKSAGETIYEENDNNLLIGSYPGETEDMNGYLDEIRVSSVIRSEDWLLTEVDNQSDPASFYTSIGAAEIMMAPGGVHNSLTLWLKADQGVKNNGSTVSSGTCDEWVNSVSNSNFTEVLTGTADPTLVADDMNYNPTIQFDGSNDNLVKNNINSNVLFDTQDNTIFFVYRRSPEVGTDIQGGWEEDGSDKRAAYFESGPDGQIRSDLYNDANKNLVGTTDYNDQNVIATVRADASDRFLYVNGVQESQAIAASMTHGLGDFAIGSRPGDQMYAPFHAAEMIIYDRALTTNEINRVESYLALKYGITLENSGASGDYLASNSSTFWDADTESGYHNHVTIIGRDDMNGLYQKQSISPDDSIAVYIDVLAADNAANTGVIGNDHSYLAIGHNGEPLSSFWNETEMPAGITSRLMREWKITNTNFSETYSLEIEWEEAGPFDINDIRLLVDSDTDFSNATILGPANGLTFTEGSIIVSGINTSHVPVNSTTFITLGSVSTSTPLPIELTSFIATPVEDQAVELRWETATEINNDYFTIERSVDTEDWEQVSIIIGAGNSTTSIQYTDRDFYPYTGTSYYRLKQTDFDGQFSYSEVVTVVFEQLGPPLTAFPMPARDYMTVEGAPTDLRRLKVYSQTGQDLSGNIRFVEESDKKVVLDISILEDGIYILNPDDREKSLRFVKEQ